MNPTIDENTVVNPISDTEQPVSGTDSNAEPTTENPGAIRNLIYLRGTIRAYRQIMDENNRTHNLVTITTVNPLKDGSVGTELVDVILGSDQHAAQLMSNVEVGKQAIIHAEFRSFRRSKGSNSEYGYILYAKEMLPAPAIGITNLLQPEPDRNEALFVGDIRFLRQPVEKRRFAILGLHTETRDGNSVIASYPVIGLPADVFDTYMENKEQFPVGSNIGLACHMEFREDEHHLSQMKFITHGIYSVDPEFNITPIPIRRHRYPMHNTKTEPRNIVARPNTMEDLKHPYTPETAEESKAATPIMESAREQALKALESEDDTL